MDARDVLIAAMKARGLPNPEWEADAIINRLSLAGFDLIHRDENHGPTLERAANEITSFIAKRDAMLALEYHVNAAHGGDATVDEFAPFMADYFASAIRLMGEKK